MDPLTIAADGLGEMSFKMSGSMPLEQGYSFAI